MCGIIGYTGPLEADNILLNGLAGLEYRGYDSAGIAYFGNDSKIHLIKTVGKVAALKELVKQEYGVELKEWSEIQNADCVIHAVAHGEFRDRGLEGVVSLMGTERSKKILLDIKGEWSVDALNKSGVIWWRM